MIKKLNKHEAQHESFTTNHQATKRREEDGRDPTKGQSKAIRSRIEQANSATIVIKEGVVRGVKKQKETQAT